MRELVGGIIPAAGAGCFVRDNRKISKLLAEVGGLPIIGHVVANLKASQICSTIVVGKNHLYGDQIQHELMRLGHTDLVYTKHHWRLGTAEVLSQALSILQSNGLRHGIMIFADHLFIQPETIKQLEETHLAEQPVITMLTIPVRKNHPLSRCFSQYGVVKRDHRGQVCGTIERRKVGAIDDLPDGEHVNSSVFVFDLDWVDRALPEIGHVIREDGFTPELHVTHLLGVASKHGAFVKEVCLDIPEQAIQVNTEDDLRVARQLCQQQYQLSIT
ncbi:MAG: NTP transferase domain-containing protein [bacterium]|nr:NTP transferase domain-containing protein [bacterium]